jgi:hypothetical protein
MAWRCYLSQKMMKSWGEGKRVQLTRWEKGNKLNSGEIRSFMCSGRFVSGLDQMGII